jgi:DNA (cytosine-5)-methyltransferase 1
VFLFDTINDLKIIALPVHYKHTANQRRVLQKIPNHEYMIGGFSTMHMSRNRVRNWNEVSASTYTGRRQARTFASTSTKKWN